MNERLTIQDLTDLLASKHSMTKKDAEAFVKEFFLLIEEALESENYVKIKGLGTFKLIEVDNRESVNVNTGERFQIKGHTKVSFTPDTNLRDTINKPFAHFETVVLNDNTILEDTPEEDVDVEDDEVVEEAQTSVVEVEDEVKAGFEVTENADSEVKEPKDAPDDIYEDANFKDIIEEASLEEPTVERTVITVEEKVEVSETQNEEKQDVVEEAKISTIEQQIEPINQKVELTAEQIIAQELQKANLKSEVAIVQPESIKSEVPESSIPKKEDTPKKEKSPVPYLIAIIIIVLLLCGGAVVFIYYPDLFSSSVSKETLDMPVSPQPAGPSAQFVDTIAKKDSVVNVISTENQEVASQLKPAVKQDEEAATNSPKQDKKENQSQASTPAYSDSAVYTITGTKGTHTIVNGETLTKVSLRYYGTKALWPYIVKHNKEIIKNPDNVPYGTTIKIPELTKK